MSRQAKMDGWHWFGLDDNFPIRQALPIGLGFVAGLVNIFYLMFFTAKATSHLDSSKTHIISPSVLSFCLLYCCFACYVVGLSTVLLFCLLPY